MNIVEKMDRLEALYEQLRDRKPRPDKLGAWFSASALLTAEGEIEALVDQLVASHEEIRSTIGRGASPTGVLRWIYAGLLTAHQVPVERFAAARSALRASVRGTKTGSMYAGGSRAALILCLSTETDTPVERFFEMKKALRPPWWRADSSVTDTYAAAHAGRGDEPFLVKRKRDQAEQVFSEFAPARGARRDGAKLACLLGAEPRTVLRQFEALEAARKSNKILRRNVQRSALMTWAVQGLDVDDALAIAELSKSMPKSVQSMGEARTALAHLVYTSGRPGLYGEELAAMSAIIAAQTAVLVSVTAASSVVVTTTATS